MAERRRRTNPDAIRFFLERLSRFDIRIQLPELQQLEVFQVARSERLTIYDAAYLQLARQLNLPLATFDDELTRSATRLQVELL